MMITVIYNKYLFHYTVGRSRWHDKSMGVSRLLFVALINDDKANANDNGNANDETNDE